METQYQDIKETKIGRNQEVIKDEDVHLQVKPHPKAKRKTFEKPKIDVECPSCKQRKWIEFDKRYSFSNCEYNINTQKHQIDKEVWTR